MTPNRRWLLAAGAALLLGGLGLWAWLPRGTAPEHAALVPQAAQAELRWRVGSAQQYRIATDSTFSMGAGAAAAQALDVHLKAQLELRTLQAGADTALVGMRLSAVDLQVAGQSDPETNRALAAPFRVKFVAGGMPASFEFPATISAHHRQMLEALVRTFQVTMRSAPAWSAQESNASGSHEATYERTGSSLVAKRKQHFVSAPTSPMLAGAEITSTESFSIEPGRDWLVAMTVDETLRSKGQGGPAVEIRNRAKLEATADVASAGRDGWDFAAAAALAQAQGPAVTPLPRQQAQGMLSAELAALDAAKEGRSVHIHRLRDLLRSNAAMPAALLGAMKTQKLSDRTRADLYLAFELAGTAPAQSALASVLSDTTWSTRDAMRSIVALGGVAQPSADSVSALWQTVHGTANQGDRGQLVSTAVFALGSLGKTMIANQDPAYAALRAQLLDGALGGADSDLRARYTQGVGNTQDPSLAPEIVGLLDDAAPEVRRAAAQSLGMLGTDASADQLMSRLSQESSRQVRSAIAESLVSWTTPSSTAMASIRDAITKEPDESTRLQLGLLLAKGVGAFPENRRVLQDLLRKEPSQRVRQSVAEAVAAAQ